MRFVAILFVLFAFAAPEKKNIKLWLAGDSTMSIKDPKTYPETGWGMPFVQFFDSTITVENLAKNGRSTKSFIAEKLWQRISDGLQEGDYVFIQFGHNDEVKTKATYTTPEEYVANLTQFINETRSKKGIPILLTPVARRQFDSTGNVVETHKEYSALVRNLARQMNVTLIDLDKKSQELYQQMGPENSKLLFMHLQPGEHPNYMNGKVDNTHFNELGARRIAQIVLAEIKSLNLELASRVVNRSR
jgi:lysophospholipase L1-like esterase